MIEITEEKEIGRVTHYYSKLGVAAVKLSERLRVGDKVRIAGGQNTDFTQEVQSIEIQHQKITEANPDDEIGLKVNQIAREGCQVFKQYS